MLCFSMQRSARAQSSDLRARAGIALTQVDRSQGHAWAATTLRQIHKTAARTRCARCLT
jgi:hypothetical protein